MEQMSCVEIKLHPEAIDKYYVCPVINAALNGDKNELECFLRYGYGVNELRMEILNDKYSNMQGKVCKLGQKSSIKRHQTKAKPFHMNDSYSDNDDEIEDYLTSRKHIIKEVVVFLMKLSTIKSPRYCENLIQCFLILWRSRPIPYVKVAEVNEMINQNWINMNCPLQCWKNVCNIGKMYRKKLKEIAEGPVTPRSLQQLCRCAIRKRLMLSYSWERGIRELKLPKQIKSYLCLEL